MESENKNLESQVDSCETETTKLKLELENYKNRALYLQAEFDNYKKRTEKEQKSWIEKAQENVLIDILPIIDNFELALQHQQEKESDNGIELIFKELQKVLKKYNIQEISQHDTFDPELHEAVMQQNIEGKPSGSIISVFKKGYTHNNKVIRPSQVSVSE